MSSMWNHNMPCSPNVWMKNTLTYDIYFLYLCFLVIPHDFGIISCFILCWQIKRFSTKLIKS